MMMTGQYPPGPVSRFKGLNLLPKFQQKNQLSFITELARTYGDVVYIKMNSTRLYFLFHPDYIHQILVEEPHKVNKTGLQKKVMGEFTGNGLVNSDGDYWKGQRKLATPAFHTKRIKAYADVMIKHTDDAIQRWESGQQYDMAHEMMKLTLDIVSETLFGADMRGLEDQIGDSVTVTQGMANRKMAPGITLPRWLPTPQRQAEVRAIKDLRDLIMGVIRTRRESEEDRGDLLSMLLMAADEDGNGRMSDEQVYDEASTLFIAGHETTANAMAWTLYLLSGNPDAQARLIEEVDTVLQGRTPTLEDLRQLKYTDMVLKESMRLHPPAWGMVRAAVEDITVGGYTIPAGSTVMFSQHVTHRDPRWFAEPERFIPERFAEGWEKNTPKYAYFPFGAGPRFCIGQSFAQMEAQLILAMLIQRCQFTLVPGQEIVAQPFIAQRPRDGVKMIVSQRESVAVPELAPTL
jgi:cytochrome P450